ncbi:MAG: glycosyltransferase [Acidimicrobiia bacterium]|nr:glycosyltransferase [Acidimicrobiia bacterium]
MTRPSITAAMIVRDEERYLEECLAIAADHVDEIVVVDTGSTDRSLEIARAAGALVHETTWQDDFAAARNTALDLATSEWILYIDADERVVNGLAAADLDALADPAVVAARCRFSVHPDLTRYWEYRLFRNRPDIRYEGRIHETMVPALTRLEAEGHRIVCTSLAIDHLGYVGDQTAKHHRNLPLVERQVRTDPGRGYLWYHLGSIHLGLGDPDAAEEAWRAGVDASRERAEANPLDVLCYSALATLVLADDRRGGATTARMLVDEMRGRLPHSHQVDWVDANVALAEARWADARAGFERLASVDPDTLVDPCLAFERDIFRAGAYHGMGVSHFELGDAAEAARWFAAAERCRPDVPTYRAKRVAAEHRARSGADR